MTLVNIDPHVILHRKMNVSFTGIFVGRSIGLPAPCVVQEKDLDTSHVWVTLINTELIGICFSGSENDLLSTTKYLLRGHIFIGLMPKCIKIF